MLKSAAFFRVIMGMIQFLCWMLVVTRVVSAQEPTPGGLIYGVSSEVIFPEVVRFQIIIDRPAEALAQATLTIRAEGQPPTEIPVDIEDSLVLNDQYAELVYLWPIPISNPPALFSEVAYGWRVTTESGETAERRDQFVFSDTRAAWTEADDPTGFMDITVPADTIDPRTLRESVRSIYDRLVANVGQQSSFNLLLYTDAVPLNVCTENEVGRQVVVGNESGVEVPCTLGKTAAVLRALGYTPLQMPTAGAEAEQTLLLQLMIDTFYGDLWQGKGVPDWFQQGLLEFYRPTVKAGSLATARMALRNNRLLDLDALATMPPPTSSESELWRAQSYGMVLYMADQIGVPGVFQLANAIGSADSFDDAYQSAMSQPVTRLVTAWANWLFRGAADAAYSYTIYQPETATPTPSRSPTPFRPTHTATPSDTPTLTPTVTVTGIRTATPLPSRTPAATLTPAPPTLTPRPAGSLIDTPTPIPPAQPVAESQAVDSALGLGIVGIIFVVLGILSFVYWRVTRTR
jgi:hypothetical protein